jgi:hypothetical protein
MSERNMQQDQALLSQVEQLDKEITPSRDLWAGIEKAIAETPQIGQQPRHSWSAMSKVAASFAPVALVAGLWMFQGGQESSMEQLHPIAASYEVQKRLLMQQVSGSPTVINNLSESMTELKQAEMALLNALQSQPGDPALIKMLNQVYRKQLTLIEKAHKPNEKVKFTQI